MSMTFYVVAEDGQQIKDLYTYEAYGETFTDDHNEMNVSNANARMLAHLLNMPYDESWFEVTEVATLEALCGTMLSMIRLDPQFDSSRKSVVHGGDGHATLIECALSDGYLEDRLTKLRELAALAILHNGKIVVA